MLTRQDVGAVTGYFEAHTPLPPTSAVSYIGPHQVEALEAGKHNDACFTAGVTRRRLVSYTFLESRMSVVHPCISFDANVALGWSGACARKLGDQPFSDSAPASL